MSKSNPSQKVIDNFEYSEQPESSSKFPKQILSYTERLKKSVGNQFDKLKNKTLAKISVIGGSLSKRAEKFSLDTRNLTQRFDLIFDELVQRSSQFINIWNTIAENTELQEAIFQKKGLIEQIAKSYSILDSNDGNFDDQNWKKVLIPYLLNSTENISLIKFEGEIGSKITIKVNNPETLRSLVRLKFFDHCDPSNYAVDLSHLSNSFVRELITYTETELTPREYIPRYSFRYGAKGGWQKLSQSETENKIREEKEKNLSRQYLMIINNRTEEEQEELDNGPMVKGPKRISVLLSDLSISFGELSLPRELHINLKENNRANNKVHFTNLRFTRLPEKLVINNAAKIVFDSCDFTNSSTTALEWKLENIPEFNNSNGWEAIDISPEIRSENSSTVNPKGEGSSLDLPNLKMPLQAEISKQISALTDSGNNGAQQLESTSEEVLRLQQEALAISLDQSTELN